MKIPESYKQILTPANIVTTARILLIPIFVVVLLAPWPSWVPNLEMQDTLEFFKPWIAAFVFALLALTDGVDGYLARSRNEVTTLGKFLDPLADKILVVAALLALIELDEIPAWVVLVIITREFLVSGLRMVVSAEGHVVAASPMGKVKTVAQIIAIILFIVKSNPELKMAMGDSYDILYYISWTIMIIALILTLMSMADYFYKSSKVLAIPIREGQKIIDLAADASKAQIIIAKASQQGVHIATAESCTGGLVAKSLTDVPGSSEVFHGSIVSYSNEIKMHDLGVKQETLDKYGAVSKQTSIEMAAGARSILDVDLAVSTTGIAGPRGGSEEKPVGTVWVGVAHKDAESGEVKTAARCFNFGGNREQIRTQATSEALTALLHELTQGDDDATEDTTA